MATPGYGWPNVAMELCTPRVATSWTPCGRRGRSGPCCSAKCGTWRPRGERVGKPSEAESAARRSVVDRLRAVGLAPRELQTVVYQRQPLRFRQIDVAVRVARSAIWLLIDGPNHRGQRERLRDLRLLDVAGRLGARVVHYPLRKMLSGGMDGVVAAVLRAESLETEAGRRREPVYVPAEGAACGGCSKPVQRGKRYCEPCRVAARRRTYRDYSRRRKHAPQAT